MRGYNVCPLKISPDLMPKTRTISQMGFLFAFILVEDLLSSVTILYGCRWPVEIRDSFCSIEKSYYTAYYCSFFNSEARVNGKLAED